MDEADKGNEQAEKLLSHYIDKVRRRAAIHETPAGACLYCDEACPGRNFCGPECRDDYEREQRLRSKE